MGIFGGNGFQGPGEEFGNDWDAFHTGQGNYMTGRGANRVSGPMVNSPIPGMRPDPAMQSLDSIFPGGNGIFGRGKKRDAPPLIKLLEYVFGANRA